MNAALRRGTAVVRAGVAVVAVGRERAGAPAPEADVPDRAGVAVVARRAVGAGWGRSVSAGVVAAPAVGAARRTRVRRPAGRVWREQIGESFGYLHVTVGKREDREQPHRHRQELGSHRFLRRRAETSGPIVLPWLRGANRTPSDARGVTESSASVSVGEVAGCFSEAGERRMYGMKWWKRIWEHRIARPTVGAVTGAGLGGAYYAFIGCNLAGG